MFKDPDLFALIYEDGSVFDISLYSQVSSSRNFLFKLSQDKAYFGYVEELEVLHFISSTIARKISRYHHDPFGHQPFPKVCSKPSTGMSHIPMVWGLEIRWFPSFLCLWLWPREVDFVSFSHLGHPLPRSHIFATLFIGHFDIQEWGPKGFSILFGHPHLWNGSGGAVLKKPNDSLTYNLTQGNAGKHKQKWITTIISM